MGTREHTILLLDDDPDFLEIHGSLLENHGYSVIRCETPEEAIRRSIAHRPSLIITDLMMDHLDAGFTLARQIKALNGLDGIPIIMITGVSRSLGFDLSPRCHADLEAMHVDAWLDKPVRPAELLSVVQRLLDAVNREGHP